MLSDPAILVLEDDEGAARDAELHLRGAGLPVRAATTGPDVAAALEEPAAVVLVRAGPDAAPGLAGRFPGVPLVVCVAAAEADARLGALAPLVDDLHAREEGPVALVRRVALARARAVRCARRRALVDAHLDRDAALQAALAARLRDVDALRLQVERLNEARDAFLALVGHDLRSPLAVVQGNCQLLEEGLLAPAQRRKAAETIKRQADRVGHMVDDVLERYRRAGVAAGPRADGDLGRLVRDAVDALAPVAARRGLRIDVDVEVPAPVHADLATLKEAILCALEYALRQAADGSALVAHVGADAATAWGIVRWRGVAADPFDPAAIGKGEGIRATARILAVHDGVLRWDAAPNGARLAFGLPRATPGTPSRRVLLLGGDFDRLAGLAEALAGAWEPRVVTGADVADAVGAEPPAAVVVDARDGDLGDLRAAAAERSLAGVPLLWCGVPATHVSAVAAGAWETLERPVDPVALSARLHRAVARAAAARRGSLARPVDPVSGIDAPDGIRARLPAAVADARAAGAPLPVAQVRIVAMEELRRTSGWSAGDHAALWLAGELRDRAGVGALVGRVAADAFVVALPGRDLAHAARICGELEEFAGRARPRLGATRVPVRIQTTVLEAVGSGAEGLRDLIGADEPRGRGDGA